MLANIEDYFSSDSFDPGFIYIDRKGEVRTVKATKSELKMLEKNLTTKIDDAKSSLHTKISNVETSLNTKIKDVETSLSTKIKDVETKLDTKIDNRFEKIDDKFDKLEKNMVRGMYILLAAIFLGVVLNNWQACIEWLLRVF